MAYTVLNLIKRSMRLLGVLEVGREPSAAEEQDGLEALNAMVDSWATERLAIYTSARLVFALNAAQQAYEIGPNADPVLGWVAQRPLYIEGAGLLYATGGESFERPVHILTLAEWRMERSKGLSTSVVTKLYYDYGFTDANTSASDAGSGTVWLWPIPSAGGAIALYLPQAVSQFTSINQTLALPPGYQRALAYNHAVEYAPEFTTEPSEAVVAIAQESKANIKRANVHLDKLRCDVMPSRHRFNIYTGERD
jgi:hypothetical protein